LAFPLGEHGLSDKVRESTSVPCSLVTENQGDPVTPEADPQWFGVGFFVALASPFEVLQSMSQ